MHWCIRNWLTSDSIEAQVNIGYIALSIGYQDIGDDTAEVDGPNCHVILILEGKSVIYKENGNSDVYYVVGF